MSESYQNALVITGGASGIGAASVREALRRGWLVAFCDVLPVEKVPGDLLQDRALYVQSDVRNLSALEAFRDRAISFFKDRGGSSVPALGVVACAGISRRGDPEQVQLMRDINVGGTRNLLQAFSKDLGERGLFVGLSSVVAAEGIAVKGDEEYKATKEEARKIASEEALEMFGIRGFAVAPGAIDTPMTRHESIFAMLFLGAAQIFGKSGHRLHAETAKRAGVAPGSTPAEIFKGLLGSEIAGSAEFAGVLKRMEADPGLEKIGRVYLLYSNVKAADGKIHPRPELIARAAEVLTELDVVIGPDTVAQLMLDQIASGVVPPDGLLRAYSRNKENRIQELLGSFAG